MRRGKVGYDKSSLRANAKQSSETVITRSDERRSNRINIKKYNEIATFRYTPLAMTEKRLRNKCAIVCVLFPRPFGERVRERGYLAASLLSRLAAFTLAEVLVTLGIIGVVSAMTVPTLMQNYQRQSYVTQLHKVYNELQQASLRYMTDRNAINMKEAGFNSQASADSFIESNFKVINSCGTSLTPCFKNRADYKKLSGETVASWGGCQGTRTHYSLASGASICMDRPNWFTITYNGVAQTAGGVFVDINGRKGPNIVGRDAFYMAIFTDGVLDTGNVTSICRTQGVCNGGSIENARLSGNACENSTTTSDYACFGKILNANWQMEY